MEQSRVRYAIALTSAFVGALANMGYTNVTSTGNTVAFTFGTPSVWNLAQSHLQARPQDE